MRLSIVMRKAIVDEGTQKVFCPECNNSSFTVYRKDHLGESKIYLHYANCEVCAESFVFKVNQKGDIFID